MYRRETAREKHNRLTKKFDHLARVLQMSKAMQKRFKLISKSAMNDVTVGDVRDMSLGRIKDDEPVGANVIRFNNPRLETEANYPRICKGPEIPVLQRTVNAAVKVQKGLQVAEKTLFIVSIITNAIRITKAACDELDIDSEIEALEHIIDCLEEDVTSCCGQDKADTLKALDFARELLDDARDCKNRPGKKMLLTSLCIGGGVIDAGSELGTSAVENFRCDENGLATEIQASVARFDGDELHSELVDIDGNLYVGKGVEIGGRAALFEMQSSSNKLTLVKAGGNFGITDKGADIGFEAKPIWSEFDTGAGMKVGLGYNFDTGVRASDEGVDISILGYGFSVKNGGGSVKLPFFSISW